MADTNRDGTHHDLLRPTGPESSSGLRCPPTNDPSLQNRTRSQLNVPDLILHLPLSRSPLKNARKAYSKVHLRGSSPIVQTETHSHSPGVRQCLVVDRGEAVVGPSMETETGAQKVVNWAGEDPRTCTQRLQQEYEDEERTADSLFSSASRDGEGRDLDPSSSQSRRSTWLTSTKKRASPDTDLMRTLSSPSSERQSKRAKTEGFRMLGRREELSEYHEPLRDPDIATPHRLNSYRHDSRARPTPSPNKITSSTFPPRAWSVPLGGESEVRAIDLISAPPSPRRSPSKGAVEVRRAPSVPPPDRNRIDVDVEDASTPLQSTNPTKLTTPQAMSVFRYTVNFATPRGSTAPPHSGFPLASPLSPLTPLPPSPFTRRSPDTRNVLTNEDNAKRLALGTRMDTDTPGPTTMAVTTDIFHSTAHVPSQSPLMASTSRLASVASDFSADLMPPTIIPGEGKSLRAVNAAEDSGQVVDVPSNNLGIVRKASIGVFSSSHGSGLEPSTAPTPCPTVIGAVKHKRGPLVSQGPRRITRSVSMKEQGVKVGCTEMQDTPVTDYVEEVTVATTSGTARPPSEVKSMLLPSNITISKSRLPKSVNTAASKLKPTLRSTSASNPRPDPSKLRQSSLNTFVKPEPSLVGSTTVASGSGVSTSTSIGASSRVVPSSPSKLPLPTSSKRLPGSQRERPKSLFPLGSNKSSVETATSRSPAGHSLITLSHALDKLGVPPPSRPNTSLGFVTVDGVGEEESTPENGKGKRRAKDDVSLPAASTVWGSRATFSRPTASSLKRATTTTEFGSTVAKRMRSRDGTYVGGSRNGRGTIGIFGKTGDRASKKTSLPAVAGSPVKRSGPTSDLDRDSSGVGKPTLRLGLCAGKGAEGEEDVAASPTASDDPRQDAAMQDVSIKMPMSRGGSGASQKPPLQTVVHSDNGIDIDLTFSPISADKGKQRAMLSSTLNPASSALHALSESLSSLPHTPTPPKSRAVGTRTGLRSSTGVSKESPVLGDSSSTDPCGSSEVHGNGDAGLGGETLNSSGGVKKSSLKILKRCAIFVDVRTEQGDDAGGLFVDMLKGLGARIMGRLGQTCTHIVYKNGLPNTLMRYRMLNDPKPSVVGIAWVVECAEKRARVDEEKFKVDVDVINVAGGNNKRRRSVLPKHLIPTSPGPDYAVPLHMSSEADNDDDSAGGVDASPSQDPDVSIRSKEDDLPPLERARRRRSILPGGQTRLVTQEHKD